jgi:hypothetical protein
MVIFSSATLSLLGELLIGEPLMGALSERPEYLVAITTMPDETPLRSQHVPGRTRPPARRLELK